MDIRQALLDEHSTRQTAAIVDYIGCDEARFGELMAAFFAGPYRVTQRAAWPMSNCVELHPELIGPYLPKLIDLLKRDDFHNAVRRNVVRLLQFIDVPQQYAGKVYSDCIDLLNDPNEPVAVRVFSMTVAAKIARSEPDLMNELRLVIREHLPNASPGFLARARKLI